MILASAHGFLNPAADFKASLNPELNLAGKAGKAATGAKTELNAQYFVATAPDGKVLGTTGLYQTAHDAGEGRWMGWMSVIPGARGKGVGDALVNFSINKVWEDGAEVLN